VHPHAFGQRGFGFVRIGARYGGFLARGEQDRDLMAGLQVESSPGDLFADLTLVVDSVGTACQRKACCV
jgi:hypothetical protein